MHTTCVCLFSWKSYFYLLKSSNCYILTYTENTKYYDDVDTNESENDDCEFLIYQIKSKDKD